VKLEETENSRDSNTELSLNSMETMNVLVSLISLVIEKMRVERTFFDDENDKESVKPEDIVNALDTSKLKEG
jgi:hypothetical protein